MSELPSHAATLALGPLTHDTAQRVLSPAEIPLLCDAAIVSGDAQVATPAIAGVSG